MIGLGLRPSAEAPAPNAQGTSHSARTLTVTLPPLEISGSDVDLNHVQEYSEGGILMPLTGAERTLDQDSRRSAQEELMRRARERTPTGQARNAVLRAVARAFALPMRASGIDASVAMRFVDPAGRRRPAFSTGRVESDEAVRARQADRR